MTAPVNKSLLALFLSDLKKYVPSLQQSIGQFTGKGQADKITKDLHKIQGSAKLLQFETLAKLAGALEDLFKNCPENANVISEEFKPVITDVCSVFLQFSILPEDQLAQGIGEKQAELQQLITLVCKAEPFSVEEIKIKHAHEQDSEEDDKSTFTAIDPTMLDLFRLELDTQATVLNN